MEKTTEEVRVKYTKSPEYRVVPASGIWGGPAGNGAELYCNIFFESFNLPTEARIKVADDGSALNEELQLPDHIATREVMFGMVLAPSIAISMGEWLIRRGQELLEANKQPGK